MNLDWLSFDQTVQALGWALVHFLWQGLAVGVVYACANALLRNASPQWRYGLGLLALAALAVLPLGTFLLAFPGSGAAGGVTGPLALPTLASVASFADPAARLEFASLMERWLPWVVGAWGAGVLAHSLRVYVNWQRMRRLTRRGIRPVSRLLRERTDGLSQLLGVKRAVAIYESTRVNVPTVLGWFKPVILLPTATLLGLTPRQIELVIAHELGHVRRWDYLVNLAQVCIETALFYHPVVGWVSRRVREEREKCCDDLVVAHCGNKLEYAKALHSLESIRAGQFAPALAASEGKLFERIERIVSDRRAEPREAAAGNVLFLMLVGAALVVGARLADPTAALELRRAVLADTLFNELLLATVPRHSEALLAPLDNARVRREVVPSVSADRSIGGYASSGKTADGATTGTGAPAAAPSTAPGSALDAAGGGTRAIDDGQRPAWARSLAGAPERPPDRVADESRSAVPAGATDDGRRDRRGAGAPTPVVAPPELAWVAPPVNQATARPAGRKDALASPAGGDGAAAPPQPASGPVALERRAPDYPIRARMAGQTGHVVLSFAIGWDGRPRDIEIEEAFPRRVFEKSSMRALRGWRFDRASVAPGTERLMQRFDFNLEHGSPLIGNDSWECRPITGTRICRMDSPTSLKMRAATAS